MRRAVVVGIGNPHRRDDGVGPAVAERVAAHRLSGVQVLRCAAEPAALLQAWAGADLAVLVDAADGEVPGRVRSCGLSDLRSRAALSTHDLDLAQTYELAHALGEAPRSVVVVAVDAPDTGHGPGLSPAVAAALGEAERMVLGILGEPQEAVDEQP